MKSKKEIIKNIERLKNLVNIIKDENHKNNIINILSEIIKEMEKSEINKKKINELVWELNKLTNNLKDYQDNNIIMLYANLINLCIDILQLINNN